jgi:transposase-like protein
MLTVVHDTDSANEDAGAGGSLLDEIVRDGARQMLAAALAAEVAAYVEQFVDQVDDNGRRLVVRNGHHREREVLTAAGAVSVTAPRVNDRRVNPDTGERQRFSSAILPAWARKSPQMTEVLPLLYLHGLSTSDFGPALEQFLGSGAGLSASAITRLTSQWQDEAQAFAQRDLSGSDYVYLWVDGIHLKVRLEQQKLCLLVMIGVRADGRKELVAITDGYRESSESWAGSAARLPPARHDSTGTRSRRWCARVLESDTRGVPSHPRATVLVPQAGQCSFSTAEIGAPRCARGDARDL